VTLMAPRPKQYVTLLAFVMVATACRGPDTVPLAGLADSRDVELEGQSKVSLVPSFPAELELDVDVPLGAPFGSVQATS